MNHPLPGKPVSTGSSLASALALAAGGISPDLRKRPVEGKTIPSSFSSTIDTDSL
jgi:hypothetical protein